MYAWLGRHPSRWTDRYIDVRAELCQAKHAVELKQTAAREAAAKKAGERAVREAAARAEQAEAALELFHTQGELIGERGVHDASGGIRPGARIVAIGTVANGKSVDLVRDAVRTGTVRE